jgi:hypothetical protein
MLPSDVADHMKTRMTANNKGILRSAALAAADSPSSTMQFLRVVRESPFDNRRLFFDANALVQWFTEVLTRDESWRLKQFLHELP